jgi:hypothetical protein
LSWFLTCSSFFSRNINVPPTCPFCVDEGESIFHCLYFFVFVKNNIKSLMWLYPNSLNFWIICYLTKLFILIYGFGFWSISIYYYRDHIQFSEYKNYGPGSNTNNRVKWMKKLDLRTVTRMASIGFIDDEGWIKNQLF